MAQRVPSGIERWFLLELRVSARAAVTPRGGNNAAGVDPENARYELREAVITMKFEVAKRLSQANGENYSYLQVTFPMGKVTTFS